MESTSYKYLLDLALILISTKFLGILTRKLALPQVVGALLAGIILGPACLGFVGETDFLKHIAEIGVIVIMFSAGLETDIKELKHSGGKAFVIAIFGVLIPLLGGWSIATLLNPNGDPTELIKNIFIGIILTATSVSITVETLKELGKLNSISGNTILAAALIDDLLGIIALTVITSIAGTSGGGMEIAIQLSKILLFFVFCVAVYFLMSKIVIPWINKYKDVKRRFCIIGFFLCLIMAFLSEHFFGVSDITGAFFAGLILSTTNKRSYLVQRFGVISYLMLSPVFFASIGLRLDRGIFSWNVILFALVIALVAILTKVVGCGIAAKTCHYSNYQSIKIGMGMSARGEVALIVLSKGVALALVPEVFVAPIIIMVVITAVVTPIMLKSFYKYQAKHAYVDSSLKTDLVDRHTEKYELEQALCEKKEMLIHNRKGYVGNETNLH
jgi:Kef-type K+ transport system membrane component KefB